MIGPLVAYVSVGDNSVETLVELSSDLAELAEKFDGALVFLDILPIGGRPRSVKNLAWDFYRGGVATATATLMADAASCIGRCDVRVFSDYSTLGDGSSPVMVGGLGRYAIRGALTLVIPALTDGQLFAPMMSSAEVAASLDTALWIYDTREVGSIDLTGKPAAEIMTILDSRLLPSAGAIAASSAGTTVYIGDPKSYAANDSTRE